MAVEIWNCCVIEIQIWPQSLLNKQIFKNRQKMEIKLSTNQIPVKHVFHYIWDHFQVVWLYEFEVMISWNHNNFQFSALWTQKSIQNMNQIVANTTKYLLNMSSWTLVKFLMLQHSRNANQCWVSRYSKNGIQIFCKLHDILIKMLSTTSEIFSSLPFSWSLCTIDQFSCVTSDRESLVLLNFGCIEAI